MPSELNFTEKHDTSTIPAIACRLCLDTESRLFSISKLHIVDSIRVLTGIEVCNTDGLPQHICGYCKHYVEKFMLFRKRCLIARDVLKSAVELEVEITTDLIRSIDRAALHLTWSFVVTNDFIDCLNKDCSDNELPAQENATEVDHWETNDDIANKYDQSGLLKVENYDQLELLDEINYADDQPIPKEEEINHSNNQFTLVKNGIGYANDCNESELLTENNRKYDQLETSEKEINNTHIKLEPSETNIFIHQLERLNDCNINYIAKDNNSNNEILQKNLAETLHSDSKANIPLGDKFQNISCEELDEGESSDEDLAIQNSIRDVCTSDCKISYNEILSIKASDKLNDKEEILLCETESDVEPEILPPVKISKETNVSLDIKLTQYDKNYFEKFFMKHYRFKEVYSEEKACLLERLQKVLEYNDSKLVKLYDEDKLENCNKRRKKIFIGNYIWVSSEKKRAEFKEKFNTKIIMLTKEEQIEEFKARALSPAYIKKLFKCVICFQGFMAEKPYMFHMKVHDPIRGKFKCDICSYYFANLVKYRDHVLTHKYKFICQQCNYTTNTLITAKDHHKWHTGHRHECKYCGVIINGRSTYFAHIKHSHPSELVSCDYCGDGFLGHTGLKLHLFRDHEIVSKKSRLSKCTTCGVKFMTIKAMNNHLSSWDDGVCQPDFKSCVQCGENFKNEDLLVAHLTVHQKKYGCDLCKMSFIDESSLTIHYQRKHLNISKKHNPKVPVKQKKVMCEYCGKYVFLSNMTDHRNAHLGIQPYSCEICSRSFNNKYALKSHAITHTNLRPFKCDLCDMTFQNAGNLKRHQYVHTRIKQFECEICKKMFGCKGSVKTHIRHVHMKVPLPPRVRKRVVRVLTTDMDFETTQMEFQNIEQHVETTEMEVETTEMEVVEDMSWMPEFN